MKERKYLVVFELEEQLKTMCLKGEDFCRVTSRGKAFIPEGANLVYIGEDPYTVSFQSKRKKPVTLVASQVREARPGAKGAKVANLKDLA
jgi:hypothetical protein